MANKSAKQEVQNEQAPKSNKQGANVTQSNQPDEQQLKTVSAVGYLGILFLVPYLMFPKEKFAVFHANQGLLLLIVAVGINIIMPIIGTVTFGLGFLLYPLVWIAILAMLVIGILNAVNGKMKRLPLIGNFDLLKVQK